MTDLRDELARLLVNEPETPYDVERVVRSGRRARRRHHAAVAAAGTVGAAGLAAAVIVPVMAGGGTEPSISSLDVPPSPAPTASKAACYVLASPAKDAKRALARLSRSGRVGAHPTVTKLKGRNDGRALLEVCSRGTSPANPLPHKPDAAQRPAGPPYHYTEQPTSIASRLEAQLHDRVTKLGLTITYTRAFSQESSNLDKGHPSYFDGNVDVHEPSGYADIGVQVRHEITELVPFDGDCTAADHCSETKLPDGSVLRTGQVKAGPGDVIRTAEVHRPDGVIVQAQESNYPFGPDAGSQPHGDQPLTLDQLVNLAEDDAFTF